MRAVRAGVQRGATVRPFRLCFVAGAFATLLALAPAHADWTPARAFRNLDRSNARGLPHATITALAQDREGLLWIATLDGLATFDGRVVEPVAAVAGAPARGVLTAVVARRAGGVYAASHAGVHAWDGRNWSLVPSARGVAALAELTDGQLAMADVEGAVWRLRDGRSWERDEASPVPASVLAAGHDGALWVGVTQAVWRVHGGRAEAIGASLPARPTSMLVAQDGRVWVATQAGSLHWARPEDPSWTAVALPEPNAGPLRALAEDRRGRIWAGGLRVAFGNATGPWTVWNSDHGVAWTGVLSLLADREGTIWLGSNGVGLQQWTGEAWSHRRFWQGVGSPGDRLVAYGLSRGSQPGSLLVAVINHGVLRLLPGRVEVLGEEQAFGWTPRHAMDAAPGRVWVAGNQGIYESVAGGPMRRVLELPSGFATGLFRAPDGVPYATTSAHGVYRFVDGRWTPLPTLNARLPSSHVRSLTWLSNGELWVATLRGVGVFAGDQPVAQWTSVSVPALPESVSAVLEVASDEVWVAGVGGVAIRKGRSWRRVGEADGLPGHTVYALARAPDGAIWAGGSAGVGRFAGGRWSTWDSRSGLIEDECNVNALIAMADGSVYVGTRASLARFDPGIAPLPPPALRLAWREAPQPDPDGVVRLAAAERSLRLRWSAAWLGPRGVEYRTRVPQLRPEWSAPTADDRLGVENLTPGTWEVEVEARIEGAAGWSEPLRLEVLIAPHWHERTVTRVLAIALLLAAVLGAVRLRLRALRRHAAALEATVRERTAELAEKVAALEASEQRAQAASGAKTAFLATMSHELRTPLNAILGFVQLVTRDPSLADLHRERLAIVNRSGLHLLALINSVLSLSKIEAGQVTLDLAPFEPAALLQAVEELLTGRARGRGVALTVDRDGLPPALSGDEAKLRQILTNLVGNAIKFTPEGGHVEVRARWLAGRARFEVEDTGIGVAPDDVQKLFGAFSQAGAGRRAVEGTGLGLSISRSYARQMGGDILHRARPGGGSIFTVEVELPEVEAASVSRKNPEGRVSGLAAGQAPPRVLVADDDADSRRLLATLLSEVGFQVQEAGDGREAVELARHSAPDVAVLDIHMPHLDGAAAVAEIRRFSAIPIVAVTASAFEEEHAGLAEAGFDQVLLKPFQEEALFAMLESLIGVRLVRSSSASAIAARPSQTLDPARLARLDTGWREDLRAALRDGDLAVVRRLVADVAEPQLRIALHDRVESFRFDEIEAALGPAPAGD